MNFERDVIGSRLFWPLWFTLLAFWVFVMVVPTAHAQLPAAKQSTGNDCVPLAFTALSVISGHPVSYDYWYATLMPDGEPAGINTALRVWRWRMPAVMLVPVVSKFYKTDVDGLVVSGPLQFEERRPHLWIGETPDGSPHAAILYFHSTYADLVSPSSADGTLFVVERLSYAALVRRTYAIYRVGMYGGRFIQLIND